MSEHGGGEAASGGGESGVIASLLAKVGFQVSTAGLDGLHHRLEGIKHAVHALVAFQALEAIHSLGERFAGFAENLESSALQAGLTTSELQKLQYAASQNAISAQDASMGLVRLGRTMFQAQKGGKQAIATFERLGISEDQLKSFTSTKEAFLAVADGVNKLKTQQEKLGVTQQVFGRSGAKYLKLFAEGSDGIVALGERAQKVGAIISEKSVENLAKFEDSASSFKLVLRGLLANMAGTFIPGITRGLRALEDVWSNYKDSIASALSYIGNRLGFALYVAKQFFDVAAELAHRALFGGAGIGGTINSFLMSIKNIAVGVIEQISSSLQEVASNGTVAVFLGALKELLTSIGTVGGDLAGIFVSLANGLSMIASTDTNGLSATTNALNGLLSVLTAIVNIANDAATGINFIMSGKLFSSATDARDALFSQLKTSGGTGMRFMLNHPGNFASGIASAGAMASGGSAALNMSAAAPATTSGGAGPMHFTSSINVQAAPGMSTEDLSRQIADKQNAGFSQMLRESRRDFASPLVY